MHQLRLEKKHLQEVIQNLKHSAMNVFSEVDTLNKRCVMLEKQHKQREIQEKQNLDKLQQFTNKYQFMSRMVQKIDSDYQAAKKSNAQLIKKFNGERQLVMQLK